MPTRSPSPATRTTRVVPGLPAPTRWALLATAIALIPIGVAGLVLPGLQGMLTLLTAAGLLSLVHPPAYRALRMLLRRWPRGWRRFLRLRARLLARLSSRPVPSAREAP